MSKGFVLLTTLPIVIGLAAADYNGQVRAKDLSDQIPKELWQQPANIAAQDLFHGPWGDAYAPDPAAAYRFKRTKQGGMSPGMTVVDPRGREWSVKQAPHDPSRGSEGPVEVVLSRVLSAVGYHQPPVYYLPAFTLADTFGSRHESGGRFRLKLPDLKEGSEWDWKQNPFAGTRPHQGLLVILVMFNSVDLKNSNNSVYEHKTADGSVEQWYVVRDLGASLGAPGGLRPKRGDPDQFAASPPFLTGMNGDHVTLGYTGWRASLVRDSLTAEDVRWACGLLAQLTETQWYDAFRAGGFEKPTAEKFIKTLRQKIAEGLALPTV